MKYVIVGSGKKYIGELRKVLYEILPENSEITSFENTKDAIEYAQKEAPFLYFSDVKINGEDGIKFAKDLYMANPDVNLIYITDVTDYALQAWNTQASGYFIIPFDKTILKERIDRLYRYFESHSDKIFFRCFGNFEIFYKREIVKFERKQCKEFLAYLIDRRGAEITESEIRAALWEDALDSPSRKSYIRTIASCVRKGFEAIGFDDILRNNRGMYSLNPKYFDCDYYRYLDGTLDEGEYTDEYMSQYSWAEMTLASLNGGFEW